ncbi:MAG: type II secretion system F family protein [Candidatus Omnitrophota bacterium]
MTLYSYKARDEQGTLISDVMEADNEDALISQLSSSGYSVIEIRNKETEGFSFEAFMNKFKHLKKKEVILFTRQLATLLRGGTALAPSLTAVMEQTTDKRFKVVLEEVSQSVQKGESFSEALDKHPEAFPELFVSMVEVGEAGGLLDKVLDRLSILGSQEMEMQARVIGALVYPMVLVSVAFIVINFLVIGVLPKFIVVFSASGAKLPLPTQIVMGVSWTLRRMWVPLFGGSIVFFVWLKNFITKNEKRKEAFHRKLLKVPVMGELYAKIQISRFTRVTSALISSGVPILQALDVVEKTVSNFAIRKAIRDIKAAISQGHSLVEPFKESGLFNPMVIQMISTGEKSGNLDEMLDEVANFYEPEIEYTIKNLTSLLEPFMLLAMGGVVAFIALSVLLPIFNLIKVFRG